MEQLKWKGAIMKKLQNKFTGGIGRLSVDIDRPDNGIRVYDEDGVTYSRYNSIAELNEHWEDYEEPDKYFWIDVDGYVTSNDTSFKDVAFETFRQNLKSIGNYFVSKEEAEKAVEKLKALKRLKDKGFRFDGWDENHHNLGIIEFSFPNVEESVWDFDKDLDLLFGGEE